MKAPDKIYLGIQDLGSGYVYALSLDNNGEQEYIRKDALLDWLNYVKTIWETPTIRGEEISEKAKVYAKAYKNVIDKINSL